MIGRLIERVIGRVIGRVIAPTAVIVALAGCSALLNARHTAPPATEAPAGRASTHDRAAVVATANATTSAASGANDLPADPPEPEPTPAASDSAGVARLATLAQLWHTVSLHHPWVSTRGVPWDSALIVATTRVRLATSDSALTAAYTTMLRVLRDPLTRVVPAGNAEPAPVPVAADRTADSLLIIRIAPTAALNANDSAIVAQSLDGVFTRVVIDVRGAPSLDPAAFAERLDAFLARTGAIDHLALRDAAAPTIRTRHVAMLPAWNALFTSTTFHDGWQSTADRVVRGRANSAMRNGPRNELRIAMLADSGSTVPLSLLALHDAARISLFADGALREAPPVPRVRVPLSAERVAIVRVGDLVHLDGSLDVVPDTVLSHGTTGTTDVALQTTLARLRAPARLPLAERPLPQYVAPAVTPVFYDTTRYPFMGARLLGGFRVWSAMRTRHAHRDLYDDDLDAVFARVIPKLEAASSASAYAQAIGDLAASMDDPTGTVRGETVNALQGSAALPFRVTAADGRLFLRDVIRDSLTTRLQLTNGTELVAVDGFPVAAWLTEHRRSAPATNDWARVAAQLRALPTGAAGDALVRVRDSNNRERGITVPRRDAYRIKLPTLERPDGAASRTLADGIAYVDVEKLTDINVDAAFSTISSARGIVLDLRGALAIDAERLLRRLATRPRAVVARIVQRSLTAPCLATLREAPTECADERDSRQLVQQIDTAAVIHARIVALIDERTSGAAERFALALEQMAGATFIGSASAGAVSPAVPLSLPGKLQVGIASFEVRRADGTQVQRVGITPSIDVKPTVRGVRAGEDEVLTRAQSWLQQQVEPAARRKR